ncbi:hypothetical protein BTJ45_04051 [Bacillus mycoides]|nr:hypothetical protein BTJ45_04051 [Bacillus mycoides]
MERASEKFDARFFIVMNEGKEEKTNINEVFIIKCNFFEKIADVSCNLC